MSISDISVRRKQAYAWIWGMIENFVLLFDPAINSDRRLAEVLAASTEESKIKKLEANLTLLKEGKANPSEELVAGVKGFFDKHPAEIVEASLVKRFITE